MHELTKGFCRFSVEDFLRRTNSRNSDLPFYFLYQTEELKDVVMKFLFNNRVVLPGKLPY